MFFTITLAIAISIGGFAAFKSECGYVYKVKDNGGDKLVIVVGEYHHLPDVQKDVECLMKKVVADYKNISFVGKEGFFYNGGKIYASKLPKLDLGIPLIGIEGGVAQAPGSEIADIDNRHAELAKKKMEGGLTTVENMEYAHITYKAYEIIVRKRSRYWVFSLQDFMIGEQKEVGIINVGFAHFPTLAEYFDQRNISYVLILPNAADNYVNCEAYWHKRKPNQELSTKAICDDPHIKPFWD